MSYNAEFITAASNGSMHNPPLSKQDRRFASKILHGFSHEICGYPVPDEAVGDLLEELRFGWWDTHHQDGGTYQQPYED